MRSSRGGGDTYTRIEVGIGARVECAVVDCGPGRCSELPLLRRDHDAERVVLSVHELRQHVRLFVGGRSSSWSFRLESCTQVSVQNADANLGHQAQKADGAPALHISHEKS